MTPPPPGQPVPIPDHSDKKLASRHSPPPLPAAQSQQHSREADASPRSQPPGPSRSSRPGGGKAPGGAGGLCPRAGGSAARQPPPAPPSLTARPGPHHRHRLHFVRVPAPPPRLSSHSAGAALEGAGPREGGEPGVVGGEAAAERHEKAALRRRRRTERPDRHLVPSPPAAGWVSPRGEGRGRRI